MSHEKLPVEPKDFVLSIWERSVARIAVVGMGAAGALLGVRGREVCKVPAVQLRPVVNTVGAGDALFSCFLQFSLEGDDPILALRKATVFAAYKIGESGASLGFLPEDELHPYILLTNTDVFRGFASCWTSNGGFHLDQHPANRNTSGKVVFYSEPVGWAPLCHIRCPH